MRERNGIGSLLCSLRQSQTEPEVEQTLSTSQFVPKTSVAEKIDQQEEVPRVLNRKERRAQQRAQGTGPATELSQIRSADPPSVSKLALSYCDEDTFQHYEATFGYQSTRTNNFVHLALQNDTSTCAVVASQDRIIRAYKMGEEEVDLAWSHNMGSLILDMSWEQSGKGIFATTKFRPIQLFDTDTGDIIATYSGKDSGDNIKEAACVGQSENTLIGGFKGHFQLWDIDVTGDAVSKIKYFDKNYNTGIGGISMSIHSHPNMHDLFAASGTSSRIGIYSLNWKTSVSTIEGSNRGYTHVLFSPDGLKLYASERNGDIHCFDTRMNMLTQILKRDMETTHRSRFDIDRTGNFLFSGTSSGNVVVYNLSEFNEEQNPFLTVNIATTCIPCVSVRNNKLVLCSGQRSFPDDSLLADEEDIEGDNSQMPSKNSFQVFNIQ